MSIASKFENLRSEENSSNYQNYFSFYDKYFFASKKLPLRLIYLGLVDHSEKFSNYVKFWKEYFNNAKVFGINFSDASIDNLDEAEIFNVKNLNNFGLEKIFTLNKIKANIIIDNCDYRSDKQQFIFDKIFKFLIPGGIYVFQNINPFYMDNAKKKFTIHNNLASNINNDLPIIFSSNILIDPDLKYSTFSVLLNYCLTKKLESPFISPENISYLEKNIELCNIHNSQLNQKLIIFIKKKK
tara:strand:+ start:1531 stop:2253 length:723 start_codon:yes stop_codon:yes gene_type:complete